MEKRFYSNGKLLITGEYLVLDGASSLALPTKFGQYLNIHITDNPVINWIAKDVDNSIWMRESFSVNRIFESSFNSSDSDYLKTLLNILRTAHKANPNIISLDKGFDVVCELTFPRLWGLGTSSTLINNIAQFFNIDAFQLLEKSFGGSGYDIACAKYNYPILYTRTNPTPQIQKVDFSPLFKENIYFLYLNKKQSSKNAIAEYNRKKNDISLYISEVNEITNGLINTVDFSDFSNLIEKHEDIISSITAMPKVKDLYFSDFPGTIKSLGAWGGDFVMVLSTENPKEYFSNKGFDTLLAYDLLIL